MLSTKGTKTFLNMVHAPPFWRMHTYLIKKLEWIQVVIPGNLIPREHENGLELILQEATETNNKGNSRTEQKYSGFLKSGHKKCLHSLIDIIILSD